MKRFIAFLLFINVIFSASHTAHVPVASDECVLARSLSQWLGVEVIIDGQNLRFTGEQSKLAGAIAKLRNFDEIRREFLPVNHGAAAIRSVAKPIESWGECFTVLGINPGSNIVFGAVGEDRGNQTFCLPIKDQSDKECADLYVSTFSGKSPFFKWVADNFKTQFVETVETGAGRFLEIRYKLLNLFLCLGEIEITESQEGKSKDDAAHTDHECVVPTQAVLRALIAAGSGDISLERTEGDRYGVRFVSLGDGAGRVVPKVEFVLDTSGSMQGDSIRTVNEGVPALLELLKKRFPLVTVEIYTFNQSKKLVTKYDLTPDTVLPKTLGLTADGGTNLAHIASSLYLGESDTPKAVVAITDFIDEGVGNIGDEVSRLKEASSKGQVALARLLRVGQKSAESKKIMDAISGAVAGSSSYSDSIEDLFAGLMQGITTIARPQTALMLERAGVTVSLGWFPVDSPGLYKAGQVKDGDIVGGGRHGSHVVSLPDAAEQMVAPVLDVDAALAAEEAVLEAKAKELEEQRAALAARRVAALSTK